MPSGAVSEGTQVTLYLDCYEDDLAALRSIESVCLKLVCYDASETGENGESVPETVIKEAGRVAFCQKDTDYGRRIYSRYEVKVDAAKPGVIFYTFTVRISDSGVGSVCSYGNNQDNTGGVGEAKAGEEADPYQITVFKKGLKVPDWFKRSIVYQIFPDRFCKGIDAMAVNKPDSFMYGTWDDLPMYIKDSSNNILRWDFYGGNLSGVSSKLPYIEALGADVIYLNPIFESVSNHRYDTSDYMKVDGLLGGDAAFSLLKFVCERNGIKLILDGVFSHTGSDSVYFDKKHKYGGGAYENPRSKYRSWYRFSADSDDEYECWWGVNVMPNVNETDPGYMEFIASGQDSVVRKNLREGASGFRLDVADELPDEFIRTLREAADETAPEMKYPPVVIGEVWEDATNKWSYGKLRSYFTEPELHSVTNYPFRKTLLSFFKGEIASEKAVRAFLSIKENYPPENFYALVNMTGSHDVKRLMTEMLEASRGRRNVAVRFVYAYAAIMFTFPGVPLVYYGDETLLEGGEDPDNRRTFPWGREDARSIALFADLAGLRKREPCLVEGDIVFIPDPKFFAYLRTLGNRSILVVVSNSGELSSRVTLRSELLSGRAFRLLRSLPGTSENASADGSGVVGFDMQGSFAIYEECL